MLHKQILFNDDGSMYPWALETLWWGQTAYGLDCDKYVQHNPNIVQRTEVFSNNRIIESLMETVFKGCVVLWKPDNIGDFKKFVAITRADGTHGLEQKWLPVGSVVCFNMRTGEKIGTITGHIPAGMAPVVLFPERRGYSSATFRFNVERVTKQHRYVISLREPAKNKVTFYAVTTSDVKPVSEKEHYELHPGERFQRPSENGEQL